MTKPFTTPFAENGDVMFIPETAQSDGSVSYETGFGPDYSADPLDANVKPVPRAGHNELFNQITGSIGDIQRQGAADWYPEFAADGGYPKNAIVWDQGDRWKSQIDGNATRPNVDEIAWLPSAKFEGGGSGGGGDFGLTGPTKISVGGSFQYKISPYSSFMTYAVSATNGAATISGDTIKLTIAPGETANVTDLTVVRSDGARNDFRIAIGAQSIAKPSMLSPASGSVDVPLGPLLTASAFMTYPVGADTHLNTDWRIRTMAGAVVWQSLANPTNKTNIQVPDNTLPLNTQLQVDVRYRGTTLPVSAWSDAVVFTTTNQAISTPTITSPLNGATDIGETPVFTASVFATSPPGADTHDSSDWRLKNSSGNPVWSSISDTINKNSITLPEGVLQTSSQYTIEVRYNGNILQPSQWSPVVSFTTASVFAYGKYLAVSQLTQALRIYGQDVDSFNLINLSAYPATDAAGVAFSPNGRYLALAVQVSPYIIIFKREGDTFTRLASPASLPTGTGIGVSFSPDSNYLAIAHYSAPFVSIYKRSGDVFTKMANPVTIPATNALGVCFSPDGAYLAVTGMYASIVVYKRSGDVFTALSRPPIPGDYVRGSDCVFSPDGVYFMVAGNPRPYVFKRTGDSFVHLDQASLSTSDDYQGAAFSGDGTYLALSSLTAVSIYKRSGDVFTKLANPTAIPGGVSYGVAFSGAGPYLAIAGETAPYITVFKYSGDVFTKLPNPPVLPNYHGRGVSFYPPVLGV